MSTLLAKPVRKACSAPEIAGARSQARPLLSLGYGRMSQLRRHGLVLLAGLLGACAVHEARPAFRSTVWIGDRGISVPLPPPSFFEAPHQEVEVAGTVQHADELAAGTQVHIVDNAGDAEISVPLPEGENEFVATLELDLSESCLEVWLVAPDGDESDRSLYSTRIVAADEIEVVQGCD